MCLIYSNPDRRTLCPDVIVIQPKKIFYGRNKKKDPLYGSFVPKEGFEPSWEYSHYALNVARLPVPPLRHVNNNDYILFVFPVKIFPEIQKNW